MRYLIVGTVGLSVCVATFSLAATAGELGLYGIYKAVSPQAKQRTGSLDMSPDYIYGADDGMQWRKLSCSSKICRYKIVEPRPRNFKHGKKLCVGGKRVKFVQVSKVSRHKYVVSFQAGQSAGTACFKATYRQ